MNRPPAELAQLAQDFLEERIGSCNDCRNVFQALLEALAYDAVNPPPGDATDDESGFWEIGGDE